MLEAKSELKQQVEVPDEFLCPISTQIMSNPVMAEDGETYERTEIERYFAQKTADHVAVSDPSKKNKDNKNSNNPGVPKGPLKITSPLRSDTVIGTRLTPNLGIYRQIQRFLESHPSVREDLYLDENLIKEAVSAIESHDMTALYDLTRKDKRLLVIEIKDSKRLIDFVCAKGDVKMLSAVITLSENCVDTDFNNTEKLRERLLLCQQTMGDIAIFAFISALKWNPEKINRIFMSQVVDGVNGLVGGFVRSNVIDVDALLDPNKNTAAHIAVLHNQRDTLELLIQLGADVKQVNADNLNVKQLAEQNGGRQLVRDISQWRQNKKSEALLRRIDQLESENVKLKEAMGSMQNELSAKADTTALSNMSSRFFTSFVRKSMLTESELKEERDFVSAIKDWRIIDGLISRLKNREEHDVFSMPNCEGDVPLIAAAQAGNYEAFYLLEKEIGNPDVIASYLLMLDMRKFFDTIGDLIPETRPGNADINWVYNWLLTNSRQPWKKTYIQRFYDPLRNIANHIRCMKDLHPIVDSFGCIQALLLMNGTIHLPFIQESKSEGVKKGEDTTPIREIRLKWNHRTQWIDELRITKDNSKYDYYRLNIFILPKPEQHDDFVTRLVNDLTKFKQHVFDLREQAEQKHRLNFSMS